MKISRFARTTISFYGWGLPICKVDFVLNKTTFARHMCTASRFSLSLDTDLRNTAVFTLHLSPETRVCHHTFTKPPYLPSLQPYTTSFPRFQPPSCTAVQGVYDPLRTVAGCHDPSSRTSQESSQSRPIDKNTV